jgi:precorrin-6A/cobalt-precorrin-6A reductase
MFKILILGGTSQARAIAAALAGRKDLAVSVALAGRTKDPVAYPEGVEMLVGGFGGVAGLAYFLRNESIDLLIDATHPFAAGMSGHAAEAARLTGTKAVASGRPAWEPRPGDNWTEVAGHAEAIEALGKPRRRVFLSIGRQHVHLWQEAPQHFYLMRSVEPIDNLDAFPDVEAILARGPFNLADEKELMTSRGIDVLVTKNAGGEATKAKLDAARVLGLPVILIRQPVASALPVAGSVEDILAIIAMVRKSAAY